MTCKNCIHEVVCNKLCPNGLLPYQNSDYPAEIFCLEFKNQEDVELVRHGKWLDMDVLDAHYQPVYKCSECGKEVADNYISCHKYCLHCGAKMDGGKN